MILRHFIGLFIFTVFLGGCATFSESNDRATLYLKLGISHLEKRNYPLALQNLLQSEKYNPHSAPLHNALALTYYYRDRYDLAEKHFQEALRIDPKATETRNDYSRLLSQLGKYEQAKAQLDIAIADLTYPQPDKSYFNYGYLYFQMKEFDKSLSYFEKSIDFKRDDCTTLTYYGRSLFELQRYGQAASNFERAVYNCQPLLIDEPHYYSALTYYRMGETEKATARFKEVIHLYPEGAYREKSKAMLGLIQKVHQ